MGDVAERQILFPLKRGSRTPEEFDAAVKAVIAGREPAVWEKVTDHPPSRVPPRKDSSDEDC